MTKRVSLSVLTVLLILLLLSSACSLRKDEAKTRVENVLNGLKKDDMSAAFQLAVCQWFDGSYTMGDSDLEAAQSQFLSWLKEKSIHQPIQSGSVQEVKVLSSLAAPAAVVTVSIDGRTYSMKVTKDRPIEWFTESK